MNEIASVVVKFVAAVLALIITRYLIPLIQKYISDSKNNEFMEIIQIFVDAAEQIYTEPKSGKDKKKYVQEMVSSWLLSKTDWSPEFVQDCLNMLDAFIEYFVYNLEYKE